MPGRSNSFKNKTSPVTKPADKIEMRTPQSSVNNSPMAERVSLIPDIRNIPTTYELAFYVAAEASVEIRELWDVVVRAFIEFNSKVIEVCIFIFIV